MSENLLYVGSYVVHYYFLKIYVFPLLIKWIEILGNIAQPQTLLCLVISPNISIISY